MLRSIKGENDQISSLSRAIVRNCPAINPQSTRNGTVAHSPCSSAGKPISTPPSEPAQRPPITPSSRLVSKLRSPARKFFCPMRIHTPTMIGRPNHSTRMNFCLRVRSSRNSSDLNSRDRTRLLETAAATPSFSSRWIRMSRGSIRLSMRFTSGELGPTCDVKTVARARSAIAASIPLVLVNHESQRLPCQISAEIVGEQLVVPMPEFLGESSGVRSNQQVWSAPQRRIRRKWLALKYIERGPGDLALAECFRQRGFIDLRSAAYIDEVRIRLHFRETLSID